MNHNKSQIVGASEFNLSDHKHPLSSPHDLMSVPVKPFNNNIFTRSLSSSTSSPSLQLSSNNSLNNILEENKSVHLSAAATSPHMSATALLQIAAQMGATVSNSNAGMVMSDKTTVATNMMSLPPLFGMVQQQGHSFMNHNMQLTLIAAPCFSVSPSSQPHETSTSPNSSPLPPTHQTNSLNFSRNSIPPPSSSPLHPHRNPSSSTFSILKPE